MSARWMSPVSASFLHRDDIHMQSLELMELVGGERCVVTEGVTGFAAAT